MKKKFALLIVVTVLVASCGTDSSSGSSAPLSSSSSSGTSKTSRTTKTSTSGTVSTSSNSVSGSTSSMGETSSWNSSATTSISHTSSSTSSTTTYVPPEDVGVIKSIQDTAILHAWNWKVNDIKANLQTIKNAGYRTVQLSPLQPKLDKTNNANSSTSSQWWKLYQPLDYQVAIENENFLGTKSELTSLCSEAKKYDIKIIVDVVANHLAGSNRNYDSQVYTQYPLHTYNGNTDDHSVEATVRGSLGGLPDVDTSQNQVQTKVANMLKEYLDCGVSGFRFDAAKHIETPDDGEYASNFWPNVLNTATNYAKTKNYDVPYYYGEILNTAGDGRNWESYTQYMSVIDNKHGTNVLDAVIDGAGTSIPKDYYTGIDADHLVLWAESHDTYANDDHQTTYVDNNKIKQAYIIQASREDAASLYFARPSSMDVKISTISDTGWKSPEIAAANEFHLRNVNNPETITTTNKYFVNVRGNDSAVIVNVRNNSDLQVNLEGLSDGEYTDMISRNDYTVVNHTVNISFTNGVCILLPKGSVPPKTDPSYTSSLVIKNADLSKTYWVWKWTNDYDGSWLKFETDEDAIGVNLNSNDNFVIAECYGDTTTSNIDWSKRIRQTEDLKYGGSQIIYELDEIIWKTI